MLFSLEALKAKKGDSLLLHVGTNDDPVLIVIDGGPSGVYKQSLRPRLEQIREDRTPDAKLPIKMLMVSHIDDDHIKGVLDLTKKLKEQREDKEEFDYGIGTVWHNSFDDVVGQNADELFSAARDEVGAASLEGEIGNDLAISQPSALVLASVPQGRALREDMNLLGITANLPMDGLVVAPGDGSAVTPPLVEGLETLVVGPLRNRVIELQERWDKDLKKKGLAQEEGTVDAAAYLDKSIFNLASIVVLLRSSDKEVLLTGDARGDDILVGMEEAGLLDGGKRHVDILKIPHHGSDRNVETDFFRAVTADHYIFSGDGKHGNPEVATFEMLLTARRDDDRPYKLYLTYEPEKFKKDGKKEYPVAKLRDLFQRERDAGQEFEVVTPADGDLGLRIDLLDAYTGA